MVAFAALKTIESSRMIHFGHGQDRHEGFAIRVTFALLR
jgi:hypothetical protein